MPDLNTNKTAPVNININLGAPIQLQRKTGCLLQLIYFVFIGWWLGALAVCVAYLLFALVITIPLGVKIINRIPYLIALREPPVLITPWGAATVQQRSLLIRIIWFIVVGFWFAALWMSVAYLLCLTIIGMPLGFWMFDKAPAILTLHKSA